MTDDLLSHHDVLLADLDGTLYRGADVIPGAVDAVRGAADRGVPTVYVTNNASRSPSAVAAHLAELGFPADVADVRTSSQAAATMLAEQLPAGASVLVVGAAALADEVRARGLTVTADADAAAAVVQGHSPDTGWRQLADAVVAIRGGARWIATNVDATLPTERGPLPGNGSMVQVVRTASGAEPQVAGKPAARLLREAQGPAVRPLVVGDRLDTDIEGAHALGAPSLMVLTGASGPADLLAAPPELRPTYLGTDLAALTRHPDELVPGPRPGWQVDAGADGLRLSGDGTSAEPVTDALRALCAAAWQQGAVRVTAEGGAAGRALAQLGLGS
ncbi:Haloacid Dehalogenase Superfamily Class (subfamily) IIA [Pseudonocardia ammonioxydans]|uniref:Haloacid Dehalogenase Superfamily Class (Subfamily) IIA n=1 Tax=Pseudonocardia ammonioxydans TaxID=260086 RepID=A0A1I4XE17_PSUAM|nr:HAD-IIA family hydrolase [Pseudonocardia ammonioxydans]SFN24171.1 Haloacid Dehalogenase Superfamily Class (subfamily) IIA [Pseudonocardia ammonioxydans]